MNHRCECSDPGCPAHAGMAACTEDANGVLFRTDMDDRTGTAMCDDCAEDALDSGVFTTDDPDDEDNLRRDMP